jgi:hypothetical protein
MEGNAGWPTSNQTLGPRRGLTLLSGSG